MARIEVRSTRPNVESAFVEVEHVSDDALARIRTNFDARLKSCPQISDAVAESFREAVETCPEANPSDLWQHVIYRYFLGLGYSDQQWKRISGFALERALVSIYEPRLRPHDIRMRIVPKAEATQLLADLGIQASVKVSKVDLFLEGADALGWVVFGAAHAKASIAERIQDDVPASLAFMQKGLLSIALTMDSKSYPPPHGNGINWGELGGRSVGVEKERLKRGYVEDAGQFDALFSFNLRTPPSSGETPSGKRIYTLSLAEPQPDALVELLRRAWARRRPLAARAAAEK